MTTSDVNHRAPGIFIISTYRSGSTLLRYIIDTHPDISSPGELNLSHLCFRLSHTIDSTIGQSSGAINKAVRDQIVRAKVRQIISDIMESYIIARGKKMWCEKSPSNLIHLDLLKEVCSSLPYRVFALWVDGGNDSICTSKPK
jgi:protein-tyrosine sulfotransferase